MIIRAGAVPAQLVKLYSLWELFLDGNDFSGEIWLKLASRSGVTNSFILYLDYSVTSTSQFTGPLPSLEHLRDIFSSLAGADSTNEGSWQI